MKINNYITSSKKFNIEELLTFLAQDLGISDNVELTITYNNKLLKNLSTNDLEFIAILCNPIPHTYVLYIKEGCCSNYTLCHEMVHLQQYERGDLRISKDYTTVIWKNKEYGISTAYNDREWEVEAFSKQSKLWRNFKKSKRKIKQNERSKNKI